MGGLWENRACAFSVTSLHQFRAFEASDVIGLPARSRLLSVHDVQYPKGIVNRQQKKFCSAQKGQPWDVVPPPPYCVGRNMRSMGLLIKLRLLCPPLSGRLDRYCKSPLNIRTRI